MRTDALVRIGTALLGGGILFVNIVHAAVSPDLRGGLAGQLPVVVPGLAVGLALSAGAWTGRTASRRFVGACMAAAGAVLLWTGAASMELPDPAVEIRSLYAILVFGPVGVPLGAALLAIGIKVFSRERLAGLCMMVPGAGFLPFLAYIALGGASGHEAAGILPHLWLATHGTAAVGAALLVPGLAMLWRAGRARPSRALA